MYKSGLMELEAVVAIARLGSFRAAALDLNVSPTAIGNAVASLENRLVRPSHGACVESQRLSAGGPLPSQIMCAGKDHLLRVGPFIIARRYTYRPDRDGHAQA
jgi:hypothetical protein